MDLDARLRAFDGNTEPAEGDMAWPLDYVALPPPPAPPPDVLRPLVDKVAVILIGSIFAVAAVCLWIGFSLGAVHG